MRSKRFVAVLLAVILSLGMIVHVSAEAPAVPTTTVQKITPPETDLPIYDLKSLEPTGDVVRALEAEYCFKMDAVTDEQLSFYGDWRADFCVSFDNDIDAESFGLYGAYSGYGNDYSVAFLFPRSLRAGENVYLLEEAGLSDVTFRDCVKNIKEFTCGVFNLDKDNRGTKMTVNLLIWEDPKEVNKIISIANVDYTLSSLTYVAPPLPEAEVIEITPPATDLTLYDIYEGTATDHTVGALDAEFSFKPAEDTTDEQIAFYGGMYVDYRISFDKAIAKNSFGLYGSYTGYGQTFDVAFLFPRDMPANDNGQMYTILLDDLLGLSGAVTYNDCLNNIGEFICGVFNLSDDNIGTTMTVELIIKAPDDWTPVASVSYTFKGKTSLDIPPLPTVTVTELDALTNKDVYSVDDLSKPYTQVSRIPAVYLFETDEPEDETRDYYKEWDCDYEISFSSELKEGSFGLYGAYGSYDVAFVFPKDTGTEPIRLLDATGFGDVTYYDLLNSVQSFTCGTFNLDEENIGETMTVKLVITNPNDPNESYVLAQKEYTFEDTSYLVGPYTVTLVSQDTEGNEGIATLEGGGSFNYAKKHHIKAYNKAGYSFIGWYKDSYTSDNFVSAQQDYAFTISEDVTYVAVYEKTGEKGLLHVEGSSYKVNDGLSQTGKNDFDIMIGESTKLSYEGDDFLYWVNISNNIVSTDAIYNFVFVGETTLRAISSSDVGTTASAYVIFKNAYDQVLTVGRIIDEEGAEELFPKSNPGKLGLEFDKWVFEGTEEQATVSSIAAKISADGPVVTVVPTYKDTEDTYKVTVQAVVGDQVTEAFSDFVDLSEPFVVYLSKVCEETDLDAADFSYWSLDGTTPISYDKEQFTVIGSKGHQEIAISAVFDGPVDPKPVVAITDLTSSRNDEKYRLSVTLSYYLPDGYTHHKSGFVRSTTEAFNEDDLYIGGKNTKVHETAFGKYDTSGIYMMNLNTSNASKTFYFKAFVTYTNDKGELVTDYSDMVKGSYNSLNE